MASLREKFEQLQSLRAANDEVSLTKFFNENQTDTRFMAFAALWDVLAPGITQAWSEAGLLCE